VSIQSLRIRELTARAAGGVSVISIEGERALEALARLVPRAQRLVPGRLVLTELRARDGELLDEALVYVGGPESLELHLHGSPPLVARLLEELGGATQKAGESLEEEAFAELAEASSEGQARMLLDQAEGALRREVVALEGVSGAEFARRVARLSEQARLAGYLQRPPRVVLAGPSNAGKSTLFNRLLGVERALVDERGGTTRDALQAPALLGEWMVELIDTAGERELAAEGPSGALAIERAGQDFGRRLRSTADWIVWLEPDPKAPSPALEESEVPWTRFTSRADELRGEIQVQPDERPGRPSGTRSLATLADGQAACRTIAEALRKALGLPLAPWSAGCPVPFHDRHGTALGDVQAALDGGDEARARTSLRRLLVPGPLFAT